MAAEPQVRTRLRPTAPAAIVPPPKVWPNGSELYEQGTRRLIGLTVRQDDGTYAVFRCELVGVGSAPDHAGAYSLLTRGDSKG